MKIEKIQLQHPLKKHMPTIDRDKYEAMKKAILSVLNGRELTHSELFRELENTLHGTFAGSISWYAEGVKLDLEAKNIVKRTNSKPQKYTLL
jgi:hypothetical protein